MRTGLWGMAAACALLGIGRLAAADAVPTPPRPILVAVRAAEAPVIDGKLDDVVWAKAPAYPLQPIPFGKNDELNEAGTARFAWNDEGLFVAVDFQDRDVLAYGEADGELHYEHGDLAELFIRYEPEGYYWELYGTPAGRQTSLFFRSGGMKIQRLMKRPDIRLRMAATVDGTLNDSDDEDRGYRLEIAVPAKELTKYGAPWGPGAAWTVLVSRYNYGRYLDNTEYSATSALTAINYHLVKEYGALALLP